MTGRLVDVLARLLGRPSSSLSGSRGWRRFPPCPLAVSLPFMVAGGAPAVVVWVPPYAPLVFLSLWDLGWFGVRVPLGFLVPLPPFLSVCSPRFPVGRSAAAVAGRVPLVGAGFFLCA